MIDTPVELMQHPGEFGLLLDLYVERRPRRVLELGCGYGGTLYHWLRLAEPGTVVTAVDDRHRNRHLYHEWVGDAVELVIVTGDTGSPDTYADVADEAPFEWLFIDADHHDEPVRNDWRTYSRLVSPGGIVAFHDVAVTHDRDPECDVFMLWQELRATRPSTTREFVEPDHGFGIGVVELELEPAESRVFRETSPA